MRNRPADRRTGEITEATIPYPCAKHIRADQRGQRAVAKRKPRLAAGLINSNCKQLAILLLAALLATLLSALLLLAGLLLPALLAALLLATLLLLAGLLVWILIHLLSFPTDSKRTSIARAPWQGVI